MKPKSINLFLMDGSPRGRIKCTLRNWTGLAYKIPRVDVEKSKKRVELNQSGVYFLIGEAEKEDPVVYVGQASSGRNGEGIINCLISDLSKETKYNWKEAIAITIEDDSLTPLETNYLVSRFVELFQNAGKFKVKHNILKTEEDKDVVVDMSEFLENAVLAVSVLNQQLL